MNGPRNDNVVVIRKPGESDAGYEARMIAQAAKESAEKPTKTEFMIIQYSTRRCLEITDPEDDGGPWTSLHVEDVPDWVKAPDAMEEMRQGTRICADPDAGSRFYRVVRVKNPPKPRMVPDEEFPTEEPSDDADKEGATGEIPKELLEEDEDFQVVEITANAETTVKFEDLEVDDFAPEVPETDYDL